MVRKLLTISGEVSEGGIRYFAQMQSSLFKLTGSAKRGSHGTIVIEVQGEEENIKQFIDKVRQGNGFYKVSEIKEENIDIIKDESIFAIK